MGTNNSKINSKDVIFCIHGNSSSKRVFNSLIASKSYQQRIIAIDLPGHGDNIMDYKKHKDFSFSLYKEYLINKINEIEGNILLIGNSLGGHLAIEVATKIKNLKGLVIFGTPPVKRPLNLEEAFNPVEALHTFFNDNPCEGEINNAIDIAVQNKGVKEQLIKDFLRTNPFVRSSCAKEITENKLDDEYKLYKNLDVPKLIIHGDTDPTVNKNYLLELNAISTKSEFVEIKNCGHYASIEQPAIFNNLVLKFCKTVFA